MKCKNLNLHNKMKIIDFSKSLRAVERFLNILHWKDSYCKRFKECSYTKNACEYFIGNPEKLIRGHFHVKMKFFFHGTKM